MKPRAAVGWMLIVFLSGCGAPQGIAELEDRRVSASASLIEASTDGPISRRARAVRAMGRIQDPEYVPALASALNDSDRELRLAALFALGQMGMPVGSRPPSAAAKACFACLDDPDEAIVAAALQALGKLAPANLPARVTPFLSNDAPRVREEAAYALFRYGFVPVWRRDRDEPVELPRPSVIALIGAFDDPEPDVRLAAVYLFSRSTQPDVASALSDRLLDSDERVRMFAARSLGLAGSVEQIPKLLEATSDSSPRVRTEAIAALGKLDAPDRLSEALLGDESIHVRTAVAKALGGATRDASIGQLRRLETDTSPMVRGAAIGALSLRLGPSYLEDLEEYLSNDSWFLRLASVTAAQAAGAPATDLIRRALSDPDRRVATAALDALGSIDPDIDEAAEALASPDIAVRGTAVSIIARSDRRDRTRLLEGAYRTSTGAEWVELREAAIDAMQENADSEDFLRAVSRDDPAPSVRRRAWLALDAIGAIAAEPAAIEFEPSELLGRSFEQDPVVVLETSKGRIRIRCLADEAPVHVANFVDLARAGFYDDTVWHRVVSDFVIQGGDPRGDGWGSGGRTLRDEINPVRFGRGTVGMPKAGKDTGGCQIFITHVSTPHLDGNYTVFGIVEEGMEVVDRIEVGDRVIRASVE